MVDDVVAVRNRKVASGFACLLDGYAPQQLTPFKTIFYFCVSGWEMKRRRRRRGCRENVVF